MKILIDISHPAHVHLFRNAYNILLRKSHQVFVTVRDINIAKQLLDCYSIHYSILGRKRDSRFGKAITILKQDVAAYKFIRENKIDLGVSSGIVLSHASILSKMQTIIFDDDDDKVEPLFVKFGHPFCNLVLTPSSVSRRTSRNIFYPGYHELAYLHPNRFTPDPGVLKDAGLTPDEPYFIMRFNVFKAHHDTGIKGLSLSQKLKLIKILEPQGKIFITTERDIEPELKEYQMTIPPEKAHSLMAYATLFLGDSQTMTSEAAVLGIPSLRCNSFAGKISYLEVQEKKYGLTYAFPPEEFDKMLFKLQELLSMPNLQMEWQIRRRKMLDDNIDVTAFMVWCIENYPASVKLVRDKQEFWQQFK